LLRAQCRVKGFERGFRESAEVWFDADTYPVRGEQVTDLLASGPFRSLRILGGASDVPAALAACPQAISLRRLEAEGDPHGGCFPRPEGMAALAAAPHLAGLRELELCIHQLGDEGARALAGSAHLHNLSVLRLSSCRIRDPGAAALANSAVLASVTHLNLRYNDITSGGALALAQSPHLDRLQVLEMDAEALVQPVLAALWERVERGLYLPPPG